MRIALTFFLFITLAVQIASADDKASAPDFSHLAQVEKAERIRAFFNSQTNSASWYLEHKYILTIVCIIGDDLQNVNYSVKEDGQESDARDVGYAVQDSNWNQLSADKLESLRSAIRELPLTNTAPPLKQLVYVGFRSGTNWLAFSYDRTNLPPAMHKIYDIIGERSETKNAK